MATSNHITVNPEAGGSVFIRNLFIYIPVYAMTEPIIPPSEPLSTVFCAVCDQGYAAVFKYPTARVIQGDSGGICTNLGNEPPAVS